MSDVQFRFFHKNKALEIYSIATATAGCQRPGLNEEKQAQIFAGPSSLSFYFLTFSSTKRT
jgi:hypothetical protein